MQHYFRRMLTTLCTLLLLAATLLVVVYLQIFSRYYTERENGAVCDAFGARQGVRHGYSIGAVLYICTTYLVKAAFHFYSLRHLSVGRGRRRLMTPSCISARATPSVETRVPIM